MRRCAVCNTTGHCSCISDLRRHTDLVALVQQDVTLHRMGRGWRGPCPLHGGNGPNNFEVYYSRHDECWHFRCYSSCAQYGDVIEYVQARSALTGQTLSFPEAVRLLAFGSIVPRVQNSAPIEQPKVQIDRATVEWYHGALGDPRSPTPARRWWHERGLDDATMQKYLVGYCDACPTAFDTDRPEWVSASYTIPIFDQGIVVNIRHRLDNPLDPKDKYRQHQKGVGTQLYGADELRESDNRRTVLIVEGEIKKLVAHSFEIDQIGPICTSTSGASSWIGYVAEPWLDLLLPFERVIVIFDPDAQNKAEKTARLFGRRGFVVSLPDKLDDMLLADSYTALHMIHIALEDPTPAHRSYWREQD